MTKVYCLGSNGHGQLGLSHKEDVIVPQLSFVEDQGREVQKIACGGNHTVVLLSDGAAYGCGDNSMGQISELTRGSEFQSWKRLDQDLKDVACGWEFTVAINKDHEVVSRGLGQKGELGLKTVKRVDHFNTIMSVNPGSRIFASLQNCIVVEPKETGGSTVYGWGSNTKCQLKGPKSPAVTSPLKIFESESVAVQYAALGKDFVVLVGPSGHILHTAGRLPSGFDRDQWNAQLGLQVHCMWTSLHIASGEDGIYSYGNGRHGQLFDRAKWSHTLDVKQIALGSEHGVILSNCNTVACWGWGEHGNCGRLTDEKTITNDKSNVISPLNTLPMPSGTKIAGVFGGCATTWIVTG